MTQIFTDGFKNLCHLRNLWIKILVVNEERTMPELEYDYDENWDVYPSPVDEGRTGFFFVDLGLAEIAPVAERPNLLSLKLRIMRPDENGMPVDNESSTLNNIEDSLVTVMASKFGGLYAGRVTIEGVRTFFFYIGEKTAGYDKTLIAAMADFPDYAFDYDLQEDPAWECYLDFLSPEPVQYQSMQNRRVVMQLMKHGDPLTVPRPVEHWIRFKTEHDREAYWNAVNEKGFELTEMSRFEAGETDYPYTLRIVREDKVDYDSVDEYVLPLWALAAEHDGDYDGWETGIVNEE